MKRPVTIVLVMLVTIFLAASSATATTVTQPETTVQSETTTLTEATTSDTTSTTEKKDGLTPPPEINGTTVPDTTVTSTTVNAPSLQAPLKKEGPFSYSQSRERWEELCQGDNSQRGYNELYNDPEWSCGDGRRSSTDGLDNGAFGKDEIGRKCSTDPCKDEVIPTGNYDIGADEGAWNHLGRKTLATLTNLTFTGNKQLMMIAFNILEWAFGFEIAGAFSETVSGLAINYYSASRPLYDLALFLTMAIVGVHLLRGRTSTGITELFTTAAVYSVFILMSLFSDAGYADLMNDTIQWTGQISGGLAETTMANEAETSDCPTIGTVKPSGETIGVEGTVCPFGKGLHAALVETPYDLVNWGEKLEGDCAAARDQILWEGPWGNSDEPRFMMGEADGCEKYADFNHDPTADRFGHGLVMLLAAAGVLIIVALSALTMIAAQLMMTALIAILPFAIFMGLIPGYGRSWLIKWGVAYLKSMVSVIALAMFLGLYLVALNAFIEATAGESWLSQIGGITVLTGLMFWFRKKILASSGDVASRIGGKISAKTGGTGGSFSSAAANSFSRGMRLNAGLSNMRHARHLAANRVGNARQVSSNYRQWSANRLERKAIRSGTHRPAMRPPKGFTEAKRQRSKQRISQQMNRHQWKAHKINASASNKVARRETVLKKRENVEQQLRRQAAPRDAVVNAAARTMKARRKTQKAVAQQAISERLTDYDKNEVRYGKRAATKIGVDA